MEKMSKRKKKAAKYGYFLNGTGVHKDKLGNTHNNKVYRHKHTITILKLQTSFQPNWNFRVDYCHNAMFKFHIFAKKLTSDDCRSQFVLLFR